MNLGKPGAVMVSEAVAGLGVEPADVLMVGDRLATDVAMGRAAGMASALVLTGDSTRADADAAPAEQRPDHIIDTFDQLVPDALGRARGAAGA